MLPIIIKCCHINHKKENKMKDDWREQYRAEQEAGAVFSYNGQIGLHLQFVHDKEYYKKEKDAPTKTETIPHLKLRRQWLDDMEKDPKCVWRYKQQDSNTWRVLDPGEQPRWYADREYSPLPKTKNVYMILVQHRDNKKLPPFPLVFNNLADIPAYLSNFSLVQLGEHVTREVEQ